VSLLVVGSIGLDTIETPLGRAEEILGGSATFISTCARYFVSPVRLVGVVGGDFPEKYMQYLKEQEIDLAGLQIVKDGKTFRWGGKYDEHLYGRDTLFTELNAFETFNPIIPDAYRRSEYVCLGNIDPVLQLRVLDQIEQPRLVVGDTMNFWITGKNTELRATLKRLDVLILSDSEAHMLSGTRNLIAAGKEILKMGPRAIVIKKGEHGAVLFSDGIIYNAPAYPLEEVYDPTGAGDAFAGGFIGYLAKAGSLSPSDLKRAVLYGNVMASFCIQRFSIDGLNHLTESLIHERFEAIRELTAF
jgi:sugar/nucleoside kinase (ribokinase family)